MKISGMVQSLAFICNLQTALSHSEMHGVHVDEAWIRLILRGLREVGVLILINWNSNIYFLASPFSYGLCNSSKTGMRVASDIKDEF